MSENRFCFINCVCKECESLFWQIQDFLLLVNDCFLLPLVSLLSSYQAEHSPWAQLCDLQADPAPLPCPWRPQLLLPLPSPPAAFPLSPVSPTFQTDLLCADCNSLSRVNWLLFHTQLLPTQFLFTLAFRINFFNLLSPTVHFFFNFTQTINTIQSKFSKMNHTSFLCSLSSSRGPCIPAFMQKSLFKDPFYFCFYS